MVADPLFETLRNMLAAANPGLVTRADLADLEERLNELDALVDELEGTLSRPAADTRQPRDP